MPINPLLLDLVPDVRTVADVLDLPACARPPLSHTLDDTPISRSLLATALGAGLFVRLLTQVPEAARYVERARARGDRIHFDHGAVRTVLGRDCGALPCGEAAVTRVLRPLGYRLADTYPLPRLKMTGRAWRHADDPEGIPQYFISELHPEQFSAGFQDTVDAVLRTASDPLTDSDLRTLDRLAAQGSLPLAEARALLPRLLECFGRRHALPTARQYTALAAESAEMAWISTEGQTFNHATDRVPNVEELASALRAEGYAVKDQVEVSSSGRVRQTALRAGPVCREFPAEPGSGESATTLAVPGSFFEFITRDPLAASAGSAPALDLAFDAGNATGIFKMTSR